MGIGELLAYLQRSNTDVLGSLPSMLNKSISPVPIPNSDNQDYDMVGWEFKNGGPRLGPLGGHFTDEFKLPNHPTFSNESKYSNSLFSGGEWLQNGMAFNPSKFNEKTNGLSGIVKYLKTADPYTQLLELPAWTEDSLNLAKVLEHLKMTNGKGIHNTIRTMGKAMSPMYDKTPSMGVTLEQLFPNGKYLDPDQLLRINRLRREGKIEYYW